MNLSRQLFLNWKMATNRYNTTTNTVSIFALLAIIIVNINSFEIIIRHTPTKTIKFNASDNFEIRTQFSDATQTHLELDSAKLWLLEPLDACQLPRKPPSLSNLHIYSSKESDSASPTIPETRWVALITGSGDCDLKTKAIHVAEAGYAHVIVKITHPEVVFGYSNLYNDSEIKIGISLLNPDDWDIIQKYVHPKPYVILIPPLPTPTTPIRNTAAWFTFISSILEFVDLIIKYPYTLITTIDSLISRCFKELILSPLKLDNASVRDVGYAFICFLIPVCLIFGPLVTALFVFADRHPPERRSRSQQNDTAPPPREPRNDSQLPYQSAYRKILGLSSYAPLTKKEIETAYRREALLYHPDKHYGKDETEVKKMEGKFILLKEAKEQLLKHAHDESEE
ncbi:unnamed protein product [Orchesella dallaii]|uniref:J domain-containing protein n=1 Tax=Orchesella dallaii TaxID=48710 RepID=A0ABP1Q883_9HEXA